MGSLALTLGLPLCRPRFLRLAPATIDIGLTPLLVRKALRGLRLATLLVAVGIGAGPMCRGRRRDGNTSGDWPHDTAAKQDRKGKSKQKVSHRSVQISGMPSSNLLLPQQSTSPWGRTVPACRR